MTFFLFAMTVAFLGYRLTTSEDRARYLQLAVANAAQLKAAASRPRPDIDRFESMLRARTGRLIVTPALIALFAVAIVLGWGVNVGTRTTNGEWWRLVTSIFVQAGVVQLAVNAAALYQAGRVVERLGGRAVAAVVFLTAGIVSGIAAVAIQPATPSAGASGAIAGLYGFIMAATIVLRQRPGQEPDEFHIVIPPLAIRRIATIAALVVLVNAFAGLMPFAAELAGLTVGLAAGLVLVRGIAEFLPASPRVAATAAGGVVLAVLTAWPLNGIADVRPEIARLIETEDKTSAAYVNALEGLKKGKATPEGLAALIDTSIGPELEKIDARLKALKKVPPEHQPLVNDAQEFLRLRTESWRLRAESLRATRRALPNKKADDAAANASWRMRVEAQFRSTRAVIGKAEAIERTSLEVLAKLRAAA